MGSDSSRARIDQYFYSKKKIKITSPASKSLRHNRESQNQIEGSPSAKGSLGRFLQPSEDGDFPSNSLKSICELKKEQVAAKRNLALDCGPSSKDENGDSHKGLVQTPGHSGVLPRLQSEILPDMGGGVRNNIGNDSLEIGTVSRNSELTEFGVRFLSLYCSELQSSLNLLSETKQTTLRLEENSSKRKRHKCDVVQPNNQNESISYSEAVGDKTVNESINADSSCSEKALMFNTQLASLASLRKCNHTSAHHAAECQTPGSSTIRFGALGTPSSTRGSSMFSPGEGFWNEAILVADGLLGTNESLSSIFAKTSGALELDDGSRTSNIVKTDGHDDALNSIKDRNRGMACDARPCSDVDSTGMHGKDPEKNVSPLPVKHFDFSSEATKFYKERPGVTTLESKKSTLISSSHCGLQSKSQRCVSPKGQVNEGLLDAGEMTSKNFSSEKREESLYRNCGNDTPNALCNKVVPVLECKSNCTPASSTMTGCFELRDWLPPEICSVYNKKGISKLYSWQVDCLQVDGVLDNRNLIYCASTSAGKSFVAEILMLRRILATGKIALLVLPYVSICAEKAEHLEALLEPVDKHVRSFYGSQGGSTLPKDTSVAVCTIEKANSLINKLLEEGRLSELGTIIIDELHMVGDQSRGYLLELMLTKLLYAAGEGNVDSSSGESSGTSSEKCDHTHSLQIVGMSATLPNVTAVADWLHAALYVTSFRPVPLEEYIKVGSTIYDKEMKVVRTIPKVANLGAKDPDHIVELCNEVVQEGHSVLIFCSSRKGCESTARHIAKYLKRFSISPRAEQGESFNAAFALELLRRSPAGLDPVLEETLPVGVAYHHAGLTVEERETVETCYRRGLVRVLTATSTLAAGVNLPARRVIFRQPRIGRDFIDGTRYKQMSGRAGRTGIDTKGESVLICNPEETKKVLALLNDTCPPLYSCLSEDRNGMTHAILEVVAGGIVQTANDINRYVRCTLLNSTKPFEDVVKSARDSLRWLCHKKFLEWNEDTKLYTTTPLGRASFGSSLCPEESLIVLDDLIRAREGFVLASDLHLVYLVTPINVDVEPDWELYYERFMQLSLLDQSVGNRVGVNEAFLMRMAHGAPSKALHRSRENGKLSKGKYDDIKISINGTFSNAQMIRVCKRLYVALILSRLVQEVPVNEVCEGFKVARGMVQSLQENAGRFASMVSVFCERLGWHDLEALVSKFQNRVSFGVRAEIVDLSVIPYVKGSRARALYKAGLRTPQAIAEASIPEILKALFESSSWSAHGSAQRQMQAGIAKKIKNGARRTVLEKAEEARVTAFSAFKSLGFEIPQFSHPLFAVSTANNPLKTLTSISGEESTSDYTILLQSKDRLDAEPSAGKSDIVGSVSETYGEKSMVTSTVSTEAKSVLNEQRSCVNIFTENINGSPPCILTDVNMTSLATGIADHSLQHQPEIGKVCMGSQEKVLEKGPVSAARISGGVDYFLDLWDATTTFFFDVHYTKKSEFHSNVPFEIHGIAICWENSPVYYLNIPKDLLRFTSLGNGSCMGTKDIKVPELQVEMAKKRWSRVSGMMEKNDVRKFSWNLKVQIQVLKCPAVGVHKFSNLHSGVKSLGADPIDNSYFMFSSVHVRLAIDMSVVAWILSPDEGRTSYPNLEKEVRRRLSTEAAASAGRSGRWKNQTRVAAHNGCCRRVAQTRALFSVLWKLLESEKLVEPLMTIEGRLTNVLADMEAWGIGVDMEGCLRARQILGRKLNCLEKEAYILAGKTFSLSMPADVANVLYDHLKLPMPEMHRGKRHLSTDKHCLDSLRNEHPIVSVIKEHRTLSKLLNSTLGSICSLARLSFRAQKYTLHGHWLQMSTATGRLSMEEPNLQCVEHMIEFNMDQDDGDTVSHRYNINARSFFVPSQDDWLLLTADYSQIELRVMAHFSKDHSLIELLSRQESDVFAMIASKWNDKHESTVIPKERDETKRLVYGILYGMGPNRLAEQLDCSPDEAAERIGNFKKSFPGVASWLQDAVKSCQQKGYVETLKGRKRYLAKINLGNGREKSKAQRQAVNSICQGSAADIIKIAMVDLHDVIGEYADASFPSFIQAGNFQMLKGRCRILLQGDGPVDRLWLPLCMLICSLASDILKVHDELVLEADSSVAKEAGLLLRTCMENAASLVVPLPVKLKVGRTWGTMEPFEPIS